jgi:hypothetical protein
VEGEAPDDGVEVVPLFEDADAVVEEGFVLQFPEDEGDVEEVLVEDVLCFQVVVDLLVAARTQDVVEGFSLGGGLDEGDREGRLGCGFGDDEAVAAGVGGVEAEGAFLGEVELALEGGGAVGVEGEIDNLGLFVVLEGDGAFGDID